MFRKLSTLYRRWRLSNLSSDQVAYDANKQIISVRKATVSLTIRCEFSIGFNDETGKIEYYVSLSGDPLVVDNNIVEAIITALWNEVAGRDDTEAGCNVHFSQVIVKANPTFFTIHKTEVIPLKNPIPFKSEG